MISTRKVEGRSQIPSLHFRELAGSKVDHVERRFANARPDAVQVVVGRSDVLRAYDLDLDVRPGGRKLHEHRGEEVRLLLIGHEPELRRSG